MIRALALHKMVSIGVHMLAVLLFLLILTIGVSAHDDGMMHYDSECCHNQDCAPVIESHYMAADQGLQPLVVTTIHGSAVVPANMQRRPSMDSRMHACILAGRVICIYVPGGS